MYYISVNVYNFTEVPGAGGGAGGKKEVLWGKVHDV